MDLVVQVFDKPERHLVLRPALGGDPVPMPFEQLGELLEGLQSLPSQDAVREVVRCAWIEHTAH